MRYLGILVLALAAIPAFAQSKPVTPQAVAPKDGELIAVLDKSSIVRRNEYVVFKVTVSQNEENFVNILTFARCTDYSFMTVLVEGVDSGKDIFKVDTQIYEAPQKTVKLWGFIDTACKTISIKSLKGKLTS